MEVPSRDGRGGRIGVGGMMKRPDPEAEMADVAILQGDTVVYSIDPMPETPDGFRYPEHNILIYLGREKRSGAKSIRVHQENPAVDGRRFSAIRVSEAQRLVQMLKTVLDDLEARNRGQ